MIFIKLADEPMNTLKLSFPVTSIFFHLHLDFSVILPSKWSHNLAAEYLIPDEFEA